MQFFPEDDEREHALDVCEFIASRGWLAPEPDEAEIIACLRIDETVPDGKIHLIDRLYYLSTRTAERRVSKPWVQVWCPETGLFVCESRADYFVPYIPTRASALSDVGVRALA